ncbi:unnamed protein product [Tuber melanosporum]|uniref:(Perigord truffle) hypothetical protein n=1 Tax=Tuber melanosporum (strain Mel28) TaxID=656061 RepID=D5GPY0_TUBMM|nr:uncharacterized protein GSTUM_00012086001 [Tuber melanosporum]CAZ86573.1 unnamed protein product [Tuber melanosporum]
MGTRSSAISYIQREASQHYTTGNEIICFFPPYGSGYIYVKGRPAGVMPLFYAFSPYSVFAFFLILLFFFNVLGFFLRFL